MLIRNMLLPQYGYIGKLNLFHSLGFNLLFRMERIEKFLYKSLKEEKSISSNTLEQRLYNRKLPDERLQGCSRKTVERLFPTQLLAARLNQIEEKLNTVLHPVHFYTCVCFETSE